MFSTGGYLFFVSYENYFTLLVTHMEGRFGKDHSLEARNHRHKERQDSCSQAEASVVKLSLRSGVNGGFWDTGEWSFTKSI